MEHPYILQKVTEVRLAEMRQKATVHRLAKSSQMQLRIGVISRLITYFRPATQPVMPQETLTTQEVRALNLR
jgi:hypothetical protein